MKVLKPKRLKKGDLIGLVAPAGPVLDQTKIEKGVHYLESVGYRVTAGNHIGKTHGYLAGRDEERLEDLHAMFADRRVKAIIALRGGYGTPRLLSLLDYRLISRNPKILVGFSDITALQLALWRKCRLITFHGPMAGVDMSAPLDPFTEEMFWSVVTSAKKIGRIRFPSDVCVQALIGGGASGRLAGGNLSLVVSLLGTRFFPDPRNVVLFLEETAEEPYRVDRMLTQLRNAQVLSRVSAVLVGDFSTCTPEDATKPSLGVEDVLADTARWVGKPFLTGMPFGHMPRKMTLPVGLSVRIDAGDSSLVYLEAAVR